MTEHFLVPSDLWTELFTYIAARVDVRDGGDGRQLPNSAMTLYDRMEREAKLARPEEGRIKDLLRRSYALTWDGDCGPAGVDLASDISDLLCESHDIMVASLEPQ